MRFLASRQVCEEADGLPKLEWGAFRWLVMRFGGANAPALFSDLMNQVLTIPKKLVVVQQLIPRGAVAEAHIDNMLLGIYSIEDHLL